MELAASALNMEAIFSFLVGREMIPKVELVFILPY